LKKEKKPYFVAKLQQEISLDGTKIPAASAATVIAKPLPRNAKRPPRNAKPPAKNAKPPPSNAKPPAKNSMPPPSNAMQCNAAG
jgi:hypothetical protein